VLLCEVECCFAATITNKKRTEKIKKQKTHNSGDTVGRERERETKTKTNKFVVTEN
jgi:hypothetical protein